MWQFMKTNYEKSNSIAKIKIPISLEARRLTSLLLKSKIEEERQTLGDELLDELADLAQIDIVNLKISETKQYHKKRNGKVAMKQYGYYKPGSKSTSTLAIEQPSEAKFWPLGPFWTLSCMNGPTTTIIRNWG